MDDSSFGLNENLRVLHYAGIRSVLASVPEVRKNILLSVAPWSDIVSKLPVTAQSLWAYPDLGYDLTGRASPERGGLWRTLIRLMDLPKGYVGFFPYTLPVENNLIYHVDHFLEGVLSFAPTSIIIFGDDDFAGELLSLVTSRTKNPVHFHVVAAPSPEKLCRFSPEALQKYAYELLPFLLRTT